jgi:hypothetical protein
MKNAIMLLFILVLVGILAACPELIPENTVTIRGTVTITRNGVPWNSGNFPAQSIQRYTANENVYARGVPPPIPWIEAYTISETGNRINIGSAYLASFMNHLPPADNADGTYKWSMKIPPDELPALIYFQVSGYNIMGDVNSLPGGSPESVQMTEGITVINEYGNIDLGIVDFKIVCLSGNLPITINGEPLDYDDGWATIYVSDLRKSISPNGDWSFFVFPPDSPKQLNFRIEAVKGVRVKNIDNNYNYAKYSYFKEELNPDDDITLHDTDKEVIFPPVDFKAFTLSGTIRFVASNGPLSWYNIHFYEKEVPYYTAWDYEIVSIVDWSPRPGVNGTIQWEAVVPAFSFPHTLPVWIRAEAGDSQRQNPASSSVLITGAAGLNNINLGTFNVR